MVLLYNYLNICIIKFNLRTGSWSDKSREWNYVSDEIKSGMDFKVEKEGEFWMSYDDFLRNFNNIQFCNLTPDAFSEEVKYNKLKQKSAWKMVAFHGEWIGKSAGGCGQGTNQGKFSSYN
jgi:calpain